VPKSLPGYDREGNFRRCFAPLTQDILPGQLVQSTAGRDKGKYFLVIEKKDGMVRVADGEMRKVQAPKKKNIKHLKRYNLVAGDLAQKLQQEKGITNVEVMRAIKNLVVGLEG